jgi:hypothetical protein
MNYGSPPEIGENNWGIDQNSFDICRNSFSYEHQLFVYKLLEVEHLIKSNRIFARMEDTDNVEGVEMRDTDSSANFTLSQEYPPEEITEEAPPPTEQKETTTKETIVSSYCYAEGLTLLRNLKLKAAAEYFSIAASKRRNIKEPPETPEDLWFWFHNVEVIAGRRIKSIINSFVFIELLNCTN